MLKMPPKIKTLKSKTLIGQSEKMSMLNNSTGNLFRKFMPRRKEILNPINNNTFDLRTYPKNYFDHFDPSIEFVKQALIEVSEVSEIPDDMEVFELVGGKYAVFHYKGLSSDSTIYQFIFSQWLPGSNYVLENRPHFEIMGEKTKLNDPNSEEEIWVPIKLRNERQ